MRSYRPSIRLQCRNYTLPQRANDECPRKPKSAKRHNLLDTRHLQKYIRVLALCKVICILLVVKRSLPALHLSKSPLIYVVTQVRFSAVMSVEKFVPDIQEKLRHRGFPRFQRSQVQELAFVLGGATPKVTFTERFEFQNKEASLGIVLTFNTLAVHTNDYKTYEDFEKSIATAIDVIHGAMNLSIVERIGLRYVDLIRLKENETWEDYLQPGLLGLDPAKVGVESWTSRLESIGATDIGKLLIRCGQTEQALPPDLQLPTLKYSTSLNSGEVATLLDCDHFSEETTDFEPEAVLAKISDLHDHIDRAFRNSVTPHALKSWGSEQ